jgi:hypothetical protein
MENALDVRSDREPLGRTVARGAVAGLAGVSVMTAFQKLVEMPLTGRKDSFAPAEMVTKLLPLNPKRRRDARLNYAAHVALGASWGAARGLAARAGLSGQPAVAAVFGTLWTGDVMAMSALGLDEPPTRWSRRDLVIDVVDKLVLAEATGVVFERLDGGRARAASPDPAGPPAPSVP